MTALKRTRQYTIGAANTLIDLETDLGVKGGMHGSFWIYNTHATQAVSIRLNGAANAAANEDDTYLVPAGKSRNFPPVPRIDAWAAGAGTVIEISGDGGGNIGAVTA